MNSGAKIGKKAIVFVLTAIMAFTFGMGDVSSAWAQTTAGSQKAQTNEPVEGQNVQKQGQLLGASGDWTISQFDVDREVESGEDVELTVPIEGEFDPDTESVTFEWYEEGSEDREEGEMSYTVWDVTDDTTWYCDVTREGDDEPQTVTFNITVTGGGEENYSWDVPEEPVVKPVKAGDDVELSAFDEMIVEGYEDYDFEYYWYKDGETAPEEPGDSTLDLYEIAEYQVWYCDVSYDDGETIETKTIKFIISPVSWYIGAEETVTYTKKDIDAGKTSITLDADVRGLKDGQTVSYRWQRVVEDEDVVDIEGATNATYEAPLEPGNYRVNVSVDGSEEEHQDIEVIFDSHFAVSNDPNEEVLVAEGEDAVLTVDASTDLDEITYTWEKEAVDEEGNPTWEPLGESSKSLTVANVTEFAQYRCTASDAGGNERTVNFKVSVANGFTAEAEYDSILAAQPGEPVTLHVLTTVKQEEPLNFKWYKSVYDQEKDETTMQLVESETTDTWTVPDVTDLGMDPEVKCVVTDKYGYSKTVTFGIQIDTGLEASAQERNVAVPAGESATLEVHAKVAKGSLKYEWRHSVFDTESESWEPQGELIESATEETYTVSSVNAYEKYVCYVYDDYGTFVAVEFDVHPNTGLKITDQQFYDITVQPNEKVTLEAPITANEGESVTYEWYQDDDDLDGETTKITTNPIKKKTQIYCEATDQYGYSKEVYYDIYVDSGLKVFDDEEEVTVDYGQDAVLSVNAVANDGIDIHYRWYEGESNLIAGETGSTYTAKNVKKGAIYTCKVYDDYGNEEEVEISVMINNGFSARANGNHFRVKPGDDQVLQVEATAATGEISYTWYKEMSDGESVRVNPQNKETPNIYTVSNFRNTYGGYYCVVEDQYGNSETLDFDLNLDTGLTATYEDDITAAAGQELKLKVTPSSDVFGNSYRYKWYRDGGDTLIPSYDDSYSGATTGELTIKSVDKTDNYRCIITDEYGTHFYADIYVTAENHLKMGEFNGEVDIDAGSSADLTMSVTADDMGGIQYSWEANLDDGRNLSNEELTGSENANTNTLNVKDAGTYFCNVTDKYGNRIHAEFHVTINGGLQLTYDDMVSLKAGDTVTLKVGAKTKTPENLKYTWNIPVFTDDDMDYETVTTSNGEYKYTPTNSSAVKVEVTDGYNYEEAYISFDVDSGFEASAQQTDVAVEDGQEAVLKVNAKTNATGGLTYEWYEGNGDKYLHKVTGDTYRFTPTKPGTYTCFVSDGFNDEEIYFTVRIDTGLTVTAMDSGKAETAVEVPAGQPLTLEAKASGGAVGSMITYQWYQKLNYWYSWEEIPGATQPTFTLQDPGACDFRCVVTDGKDRQTATIKVTVDSGLKAKAYYTINSGAKKELGDSNIQVKTGDEVKLIIEASNDAAGGKIAYEWTEGERTLAENANEWTFKAAKDTSVSVWLADDYNQLTFDYNFTVKDPCKHSNLKKTPAKDATCTADGNIEYWTCIACGLLFSDANAQNEITLADTVIKASHKLNHVDAKAPSCEKAGNTEYWTCSACGKFFGDETGITEIQQADTVVAATGHNPTHVDAVAPGCESEGNIEYWICDTCGKYFEDAECTKAIDQSATVAKATGHAWGEWVVTKPATETETGVETRTCKNDPSHTETREIPITVHTHTPEATAAKAATCTEDGNIAYWKCTECGRYFDDAECTHEINWEDTVIPAKGHAMNKVEAVSATCTTAGNIEHWKCSVCGKLFANEAGTKTLTEEEVVVAAKGHQLPPTHVEAVAPTEEAEGNIEYWTCEACGKAFADEACTKELGEDDIIIAKLQSLKGATVAKISDKTYTGKLQKPAPVVKLNGEKLISGTDYTVTYAKNKNVGKATVTIKGTGKYTGTKTATFKINPKGTTLSKLTPAKRAMTVKWKKQSAKMSSSRITGYEIQLAKNSKFTKGKKSVKVKGYAKVSKKVTSLKAKSKYYVRVRTYMKVGGTTYYSAWSKAKSAKTK